MPRIEIVADDGTIMHKERLDPSSLEEEHFRSCLAERIAWAVTDATEHGEHAQDAVDNRALQPN